MAAPSDSAYAAYSCPVSYSNCNAGYGKSGTDCIACTVGNCQSSNGSISGCVSCTGNGVTTCAADTCGAKDCAAGYDRNGASGAIGATCTQNNYHIEYNENGGAAVTSPLTYTTASGAILPKTTRAGYTFGGWYDNSGFTGTAVPGISAGQTGTKEFWAKWDECGDINYYCDGAAYDSRTQVTSGYYSIGGTATTRMDETQCTGATWCSGGVQTECPAESTGWTRNGSPVGTGWTSFADCNETKTDAQISTYCDAGVLKHVADTSSTWNGTATIETALQAKAGSYVDSQTCTQCGKGSYTATVNDKISCDVCPPSGATGTSGNTSGIGQTSCNENCGLSNVSTWETPAWNNNNPTNVCVVSACATGYMLNGSTCTPNTYTITFHGNGNTSDASTVPGQATCTYDAACALPAYVPGGLIRDGYKWNSWCEDVGDPTTCETGTVLNLASGQDDNVDMYAKWDGCVAGTYSDTAANTCEICPAGYYSDDPDANASCTYCEAGNKCVSGIKTACGGINEWQALEGQDFCDPVDPGKQKDGDAALKNCDFGFYCMDGVVTACPTDPDVTINLTGTPPSTVSPTASLITECVQVQVPCTVQTGGGGSGTWPCQYDGVGSYDCSGNLPATCVLLNCGAGLYESGGICESSVQPCTDVKVGVISTAGGTVAGTATYVTTGVWNLTQCSASNLPHAGPSVHGLGTKRCSWTSGAATASVFNSSCDGYNMTTCDAGYYYVPNQSQCEAAGAGYYSPDLDLARTICPDNGLTAANNSASKSACYKTDLPFVGAHCEGKQTCWANAADVYDDNCIVTNINFCAPGYYYYNSPGQAPDGTEATRGSYSQNGSTVEVACPGGGDTMSTGSTSINACFKQCYKPLLPANADDITPVATEVYYAGAGYPDCRYNITCKSGFTAVNDGGPSPTCGRNDITVTYDANGGSENMNPQTCPFGDDCFAPDNAFKHAGYVFDKWCTQANGSGTCIGQGGKIGSFTSGVSVTLYAQWTPCNNGTYSDINNSSGRACQLCPEGTYTPPIPSTTAYPACLNAGLGHRTSNCADSGSWTGCSESVPCEIGTYSDIPNAAAICTLCPAGKYC
ncbi:MAG: InlB B-repeat-containing protein, partial [Rickettsiales bacterium]|nr:InlB B-repeat-containing protein [Rickettsiales bacterium]